MRLLVLFLSVCALPAFGDEPNSWLNKEVPQLVLESGKTFSKVKFTKIEPDAVTISHAAGISRVPMEDLTEEARTALGYDPEKAAAARKMQQQQREQAQKEANATALLSRFTENFDEFKGITYYSHVEALPELRTGLRAYIAKPEADPKKAIFFLQPTFRGEDWIFMDSLVFAGNGEPVSFEFETETDVLDVAPLCHEWAHVPIQDVNAFAEVISRASAFRLSGKFAQDYELTASEVRSMLETVAFYKLLTGDLR
jgi:hypothetical protein